MRGERTISTSRSAIVVERVVRARRCRPRSRARRASRPAARRSRAASPRCGSSRSPRRRWAATASKRSARRPEPEASRLGGSTPAPARREDRRMRKCAPDAAGRRRAGRCLLWSPSAASLDGAPRWTPDGLFYQARALELRRRGPRRGARRGPSRARSAPSCARATRSARATRTGSATTPSSTSAGSACRSPRPPIEPVAGDRALLDLSLAGYVAAVLALFGLLLLALPAADRRARSRSATVFLPALTFHSSYPLTDSWGLALETAALASGILVLQRGPRWLIAWVVVASCCSRFTRDSTWIPVLAAAGVALTLRSRVTWALLGTGVAAAVPGAAHVPGADARAARDDAQRRPSRRRDASWGFVAGHYPGAIVDLLQADGGFVRDGAWYSAALPRRWPRRAVPAWPRASAASRR